jgi:glycosyltransferase involved in cell wall biosynthesis
MKSIIFIEPHLRCVGGIRRIMEVANRLQQRGIDVKILSPDGKPCRWIPNTIPTFPLSEIRKYSADVCLFNLAEQFSSALGSNSKLKIFWVLAAEALYKPPEIPIKALTMDLHFMANSEFVSKYIKQYRRKQLPYVVPIISGGINPEHFKFVPEHPKDYHVLYYGSARPWKGTKIIQQAVTGRWKVLKMEGLNTPQDQMYTLYNRSNVFVSAALCEGFNFPVLEAMACGCPVVCTDDGGNRDFVRNNENAIVVKRDAVNIRTGLTRLLNDKQLYLKLRTNGLHTAAESRFQWENIVDLFCKSVDNWL